MVDAGILPVLGHIFATDDDPNTASSVALCVCAVYACSKSVVLLRGIASAGLLPALARNPQRVPVACIEPIVDLCREAARSEGASSVRDSTVVCCAWRLSRGQHEFWRRHLRLRLKLSFKLQALLSSGIQLLTDLVHDERCRDRTKLGDCGAPALAVQLIRRDDDATRRLAWLLSAALINRETSTVAQVSDTSDRHH